MPVTDWTVTPWTFYRREFEPRHLSPSTISINNISQESVHFSPLLFNCFIYCYLPPFMESDSMIYALAPRLMFTHVPSCDYQDLMVSFTLYHKLIFTSTYISQAIV